MAFINWDAFEDEFTRFLRNNDILTVSERNVTTDSDDTFSGDNSTTAFLINRNNVKNIRSITVDSNPVSFGTDYTYDIQYNDSGTIKCRIVFTSAPASGTNNIAVSYDYGSCNIFPGYSKRKIKQNEVPRVNWDWINTRTEDIECGGAAQRTQATISVVITAKERKDVRRILETTRNLLLNNKKSFYYAKYLRNPKTGPLLPREGDTTQELKYQNIDIDIEFDVEV